MYTKGFPLRSYRDRHTLNPDKFVIDRLRLLDLNTRPDGLESAPSTHQSSLPEYDNPESAGLDATKKPSVCVW